MRLIIAILYAIPAGLHHRGVAGDSWLIPQRTRIGWIPAAQWAVYAHRQCNTDRTIREATEL